MAKIDQDFPYDVFRFLIKPHRDADKDGLLERYLGGVQERFEATHGNIDEIKDLFNVDTIPNKYLTYLKWIVGWTSELDYITDDLTSDELRKLIGLSIPMWKQKGTPAGIRAMLRLLTGQDVILRDWFHYRWIQGVSALQQAQLEADSYVVGDAFGDRDEYLSFWYVTNELGIQKQLIHDVMELNRPQLETMDIVYAVVAEDFNQGRDKWIWSQFDVAGGFVADTVDIEMLTSFNRMRFIEDAMVFANVGDYENELDKLVSAVIQFQDASGGEFWFMVETVDEENYTYVKVTQDDGGLDIRSVEAGVDTSVASGTWEGGFFSDGTRFTIGILCHRFEAGAKLVRVFVDSVAQFDGETNRWDLTDGRSGRLGLYNPTANDVLLDNILISRINPHVDTVPGSLVDEQQVPAPARVVVFSADDFSTWTLGGAWHTTDHRFRTPFGSAYFGTGESGYHTWGVSGTMSNSNGSATPPSNFGSALSNVDAATYKILLRWWQFIDVDPALGTDVTTVEILDNALSVVATLTKAQVVAAGNGTVEFDVTAFLAETTNHRVRFRVASAAASALEGWFVDDVAIIVQER
jgi:phage tail-like protein